MNYTVNDRGESVIAVGAPGSIERVKCERPQLIEELNKLYSESFDAYGRNVDRAIQMIRAAGIFSYLETNSVLTASDYHKEEHGSVTSLVMRV